MQRDTSQESVSKGDHPREPHYGGIKLSEYHSEGQL